MTAVEYRLRWRREGRSSTGKIYQTERAAREKMDRLLALDEVKGDTRFEDMPDLAEIRLEIREVGPWNAVADQPTKASARAVEHVREWDAVRAPRVESEDDIPF